jgi:hypothetical protein
MDSPIDDAIAEAKPRPLSWPAIIPVLSENHIRA